MFKEKGQTFVGSLWSSVPPTVLHLIDLILSLTYLNGPRKTAQCHLQMPYVNKNQKSRHVLWVKADLNGLFKVETCSMVTQGQIITENISSRPERSISDVTG